MRKLRSKLTFANVCSSLALLIAIGTGSAYAANTVFSSDIVDGEVKSADIGNNQVRSADVRDDTLANGGLTGADIDESTLGALDATDGYDDRCDPVSFTYLECDSQATITVDRQMP